MIWLLIGSFLFLLVLGAPLYFSLSVPSLLYLFVAGHPPAVAMAQQSYTAVNSFPLLAIPFFLLAGELMLRADMTERIVEFSERSIGWIRGGLGHSNILASMLFAGISGSAVADTVAIGKVVVPAMEKAGYDPREAAALTAASSIIGPIIPPSIPMIILGSAMGISIGGLFAAGLVPGVIIALGLMVANWYATRNNHALDRVPFSLRLLFHATFRAFLPLMMPVILLGGILSGVFTPTEAGAITVFYASVVGFLLLRTLSVRDFYGALIATAKGTAAVMLVVAAANPFSWLLSVNQVPQTVADQLLSISDNPLVTLLIINIILFVAGMFLETVANILILSPIVVPAAVAAGIDPLQIGVVVVVNLVIGLITPPVGLCLFSISTVTGLKFEAVVSRIWPYLLVQIVVLALICAIPALTLALPRFLGLG